MTSPSVSFPILSATGLVLLGSISVQAIDMGGTEAPSTTFTNVTGTTGT